MSFFKRFFNSMKSQPVQKQPKTPPVQLFSSFAPYGLGVLENDSLKPVEARFNEVFGKYAQYWEHVKARVLKENPDISETEYSWIFLEFKRFLALNIYLNQVGMYSTSVDEIWHEALMFTRDYQDFCRDLLGEMIHHLPHVGDTAQPGEHERALFELVYSLVFRFYPENEQLLGKFGQRRLHPEFVAYARDFDWNRIRQDYFKPNTIGIYEDAVQELVHHLFNGIQNAPLAAAARNSGRMSSAGRTPASSFNANDVSSAGYGALSALLFYSILNGNDDREGGGGNGSGDSDCSSSSCSSSDCGSSSDNNSSGSGSSCSSSSCSGSSDSGSSCSSSSCSSSSCSSSSCSSSSCSSS